MHADVTVIGGGVIGTSVAIALRQHGVPRVLLLERDTTYTRASSQLAFGGIRQLFTTAASLDLARHSLAYYRRLDARLAADGVDARVQFRQHGTLMLATPASQRRVERKAHALASAGADIQHVPAGELHRVLPGLACEDLACGFLATEDGVLHPPALLRALHVLAGAAGVEVRQATVTAIETSRGHVRRLRVNRRDSVDTPRVVCAAGAFSAAVGEMVGVRLPVVPVRQQLVRATLPQGERFDLPMVVTPSGLFWRYEAPWPEDGPGALWCGFVSRQESPGERFDCDEELWSSAMLPIVRHYMPSYRGARPEAAWAGLYEMTPDGNPLLGEHPEVRGFWLACGFSGHGLMVAPAVGEAVAAMVTGHPANVDVSAFGPGRFSRGLLVTEESIV